MRSDIKDLWTFTGYYAFYKTSVQAYLIPHLAFNKQGIISCISKNSEDRVLSCNYLHTTVYGDISLSGSCLNKQNQYLPSVEKQMGRSIFCRSLCMLLRQGTP